MLICSDGFIKKGKKKMFENYRTFSCEIAGRPLIVETGKIAQLANGSALVRYGETVILATATASAKPREDIKLKNDRNGHFSSFPPCTFRHFSVKYYII